MIIVSVIVPFYNSSRTIKATINSIINQSFKNFECIMIKDDSNDDSLEMVENIFLMIQDLKFIIKKDYELYLVKI